MAAVEEYLVRRGDGLVLLFTPPFDHSDVDPGYIKGICRHPGERRPVHPRSHLVGPRLRRAGRRRQGGRAVLHSEPHQPCQHPGRGPALQGGAIRHGGRRLRRAAARRRGGWTWYTASAGWMYQAGVEWILGFRLRGTTLLIDPCIPAPGRATRSTSAITPPGTRSSWRTRRGQPRGGIVRARRTGADGRRHAITLADDGARTKSGVLG